MDCQSCHTLRDHLATFLAVYAPPTEFELDLWEEALKPAKGDLVAAMATWLRTGGAKPKPLDIFRLMHGQAHPGTMHQIAATIAAKHAITIEELRGDLRARCYAWPRQEAMYELRQAGHSLPQIGQFFRRDHTTIMHGVRAHEGRAGDKRQIVE